MCELERKLFALPVCLGELDSSAIAGFEFSTSESITAALTNQILKQQKTFDVIKCFSEQHQLRWILLPCTAAGFLSLLVDFIAC